MARCVNGPRLRRFAGESGGASAEQRLLHALGGVRELYGRHGRQSHGLVIKLRRRFRRIPHRLCASE